MKNIAFWTVIIEFSHICVFLLLWIAVQNEDPTDRVEIFTEASNHALTPNTIPY